MTHDTADTTTTTTTRASSYHQTSNIRTDTDIETNTNTNTDTSSKTNMNASTNVSKKTTEKQVQSQTIDLITLATHCIYATLLASTPIQELKTSSRIKDDGSLVTDADGAAQYIIYSQIKSLHSSLRIVGEESDLEMHRKDYKDDSLQAVLDPTSSSTLVVDSSCDETSAMHEHDDQIEGCDDPVSNSITETEPSPVSVMKANALHDTLQDKKEESTLFAKVHEIMQYHREQNDHISTASTSTDTSNIPGTTIDHQRVSVVVDPLDGTSSYAKGYYEAVTILLAIVVDNIPVFGVIVKPFQVGTHLPCFENTGSSAIYGGTLIGGAYVMGGYNLDQSMPSILIGNSDRDSSVSVTELKRSRLWRQRCIKNDHLERLRMAREASTLTSNTPDRKRAKKKSPRVVKGFPDSATTSTSTSSSVSFCSKASSVQIHATGDVDVDDAHSFVVMQNADATTDASMVSQSNQLPQGRGSCSDSYAGGASIEATNEETPIQSFADMDVDTSIISQSKSRVPLLRAIISKSKGGGVVQKCIDSLSAKELIHSQPLYITGAGYKTMKLVLGEENEGLWFFPKPGTSLWDVAAADALLRVMGGRISDKYGKSLDYRKGRLEADNLDGIIACCDERLHETCLELYTKEKWDDC